MGIPYVALYPSDFLADIGHLGNTELGIYWRLLLVYYHDGGPLPADLDRVRRIAQVHSPEEQKALNEVLGDYFVRTSEADGTITWHHIRCDREIAATRKRYEDAVAHGLKGAQARWRKWGRNGVAMATPLPEQSPSNANQNQNQKNLVVDTVVFDTKVSAEHSASPQLNAPGIPLNDGTEFQIPKALFNEFCALYPAVDIEQTLREIRAWCLSNPEKRKTKRGVSAFLNRWLAKEQNHG